MTCSVPTRDTACHCCVPSVLGRAPAPYTGGEETEGPWPCAFSSLEPAQAADCSLSSQALSPCSQLAIGDRVSSLAQDPQDCPDFAQGNLTHLHVTYSGCEEDIMSPHSYWLSRCTLVSTDRGYHGGDGNGVQLQPHPPSFLFSPQPAHFLSSQADLSPP